MAEPVALVLGAAVWEGGVGSPALRRRAEHGARLWHAGKVRAVVVSGGVGLHPPSEAELMARICIARGVPEGAVLCEDKARNTAQNIAFSLPVLQRIGAQSVVIVTDGYHAPRGRLLARRAGLTVRSDCPPAPRPVTRRMVYLRLRECAAYLRSLLTRDGYI